MKVWITKYALTQGITEHEAALVDNIADCVFLRDNNNKIKLYRGDDWWDDLDAAKVRAENMRLKKIESLKKQIKKYENMKF